MVKNGKAAEQAAFLLPSAEKVLTKRRINDTILPIKREDRKQVGLLTFFKRAAGWCKAVKRAERIHSASGALKEGFK